MAEGLARKLLGGQAHVNSAGLRPTQINPMAIQVMDEISIDILGHYSKSVEGFLNKPIDYIITLCANEVCPVTHHQTQRLHWPLPDPAMAQGSVAEQVGSFRRVRDEIIQRLNHFKENLLS